MKSSDLKGPRGEAWRMKRPPHDITKHRPDWQATLAGWVFSVPSAHPFWHSYLITLIHLRDIPGVPPANKHYPEAEFEFMLSALDPRRPLPDPDAINAEGGWLANTLRPANLIYQFHGMNDAKAIEMVETLVKSFLDGITSPDTDHNTHTKAVLKNTIEHIVLGGHPKDHV